MANANFDFDKSFCWSISPKPPIYLPSDCNVVNNHEFWDSLLKPLMVFKISVQWLMVQGSFSNFTSNSPYYSKCLGPADIQNVSSCLLRTIYFRDKSKASLQTSPRKQANKYPLLFNLSKTSCFVFPENLFRFSNRGCLPKYVNITLSSSLSSNNATW